MQTEKVGGIQPGRKLQKEVRVNAAAARARLKALPQRMSQHHHILESYSIAMHCAISSTDPHHPNSNSIHGRPYK